MKGKILGEYPIIFAVLLASATSHATSISFSDSTFQESDWTVKNFTLGYGAHDISIVQDSTYGGNPGEFRRFSYTLYNAPSSWEHSTLYSMSIKNTAIYSPPVQRAIGTIDYYEDSILVAPDFPDSVCGVATGPVILQDGHYFFLRPYLCANFDSWTSQSKVGLKAEDFYDAEQVLAVHLDPSHAEPAQYIHPDFSLQGAPLTFGFIRATSTSHGGPGGFRDSGIDNWRVVVHQIGPLPVNIDIRPGNDNNNNINLGSAGVVPVAILSSDSFDATTVDPTTVSLAGATVKLIGKGDRSLCQQRDVNGDGRADLVCDVQTAEFLIEPGDSVAVLEAVTVDGIPIRGEDNIRIVP